MIYDIFYVSKGIVSKSAWDDFRKKFPSSQKIENVKTFEQIKSRAFTKFFYVVWEDLEVTNFDFSYRVSKWDEEYIHVWKTSRNGQITFQGGITLFPKNSYVSNKEFEHRFYLNKKEIDQLTSKLRYPQYIVKTYDEYVNLTNNIGTDMFWLIWDNVSKLNSYVFDLYFDPFNGAYEYERNENHVYLNNCSGKQSFLNGIVLCSKNKIFSKREFDRKYLVDKKEHNEILSKFQYPAYKIDSYDQYLEIIREPSFDMFWLMWPDQEFLDESIFDMYFDPLDGKYDYDRSINHMFKNVCNEKISFVGGLMLLSTKSTISKKEFDRKYLIDKKEHDIVATISRYPRYVVNSFDDYQKILKNSYSMFWLIWDNIDIINDSVFNLYFDPNNGIYDHDRNENHVFKNVCYDKDTFLNGIILCSKNKQFTQKEFDRKYLVDKKEHNLAVSCFRYPKFTFESYKDYLEVVKSTNSIMFWSVPNDVEVVDETIFDLYFDPNDGVYDYDRNINHVFMNSDFYDGISLLSKNKIISEQEFRYRYPIDKKEWKRKVSIPKSFDIVFISYNETIADENYENLKKRFPRSKRIHGVKGIHQAHIEAAKISETELFWVVDADAEILEDFNFEIDYVPHYDVGNRIELKNTVQVWFSKNPINDLEYGYGGVKLLPRALTLKMNTETPDMTTSISRKFKVNTTVSNYTKFNIDPFSTWRSAFRECAKLASKAIDNNYDEETDDRLKIWCTVGEDRPFGKYAIAGARAGKEFGEKYSGIDEILIKINNFEWLETQFKKWLEKNE